MILSILACVPWGHEDLAAIGDPITFTSLAAPGGRYGPCGLDAAGTGWCWGRDPLGTLQLREQCSLNNGANIATGAVPEVVTGTSRAIGARRVRLSGVVNTLGGEGSYTFELGTDTTYGHTTTPMSTGPEITPRHFSRIVDLAHPDLADLEPGTIVHWRLVLTGDSTVVGEDHTFVAP